MYMAVRMDGEGRLVIMAKMAVIVSKADGHRIGSFWYDK
jgi:hypothetical protein